MKPYPLRKMTKTKDKANICLICASIITTEKIKQVDKKDALFLLQILLELPQESKIVNDLKLSLNLIRICDNCTSVTQQCKDIYSEICEKVERFWEHQNKILEKFADHSHKTRKENNDDWVFQCRNFVKNHDFTGFGYPFTVHDLETVISSVLTSAQQLKDTVHCTAKNENDDGGAHNPDVSHENSLHFLPTSEQNEILAVKQEPESEEEDTAYTPEDEDYQMDDDDDDNDDVSSDNDSDYEPSPSKKSKLSPSKQNSNKSVEQAVKQNSPIKRRRRGRKTSKISDDYPNFERDPTTNKFHCTWPDEACDRQFADRECFKYHWDRHRGTPRQQCAECSQLFYTRKELVSHRQKDHPKDGEKFDCEKCGKKCGYREALLRHLNGYHAAEVEAKRMAKLQKKEEDPIKKDPITNKWLCFHPNCGKSYLERTDLKFHLDRHEGTPQQNCDVCGALFYSKKRLEYHKQKEHEDNKYECDICGAVFKTRGAMHHHKTYRHSEKGSGILVVCQICGKAYKKAGLNSHMQHVHGGEEARRFACHLCPGKFKDLRGLKRHLWRVHQFCEREEDKEQFEREKKKTREKAKNWVCHVKGCRAKFVTEAGLKKHVNEVHKGKWDQEEDMDGKFKCQVCGKAFHMKQKLDRHAKQHEKNKVQYL